MNEPSRLDWVDSLFSDGHAEPAVTPVTPWGKECVTTEIKLEPSNHAAYSNPLHVLHELHPKIGIPANDPPPTDLDSLAEGIAAEFRVPAAAVLGLLDDEDKQAIEAGDHAMIEAWKTAVRSLIHRGEWKAMGPVTCASCQHAQPAAPGLVDCAALVPSPAAVGPYRRWATDLHLCDSWSVAE